MSYIDPTITLGTKSIIGISTNDGSSDLLVAGQRVSPLTNGSYKTPEEAAAAGIAAERNTTSSTTKPASLTSVLGTLQNLESKASKYIDSGIRSAISTFGNAANGLASEFDKQLSGIFKDTNNPKASTVATATSDPLAESLLKDRKPGATSFRVDGLAVGSQLASKAGATTVGSGAPQMTGTQVSTLLNRLTLDISRVKNVLSVASGNFSTQSLNRLFTNLNLPATSGTGSTIIGINSTVTTKALSTKSVGTILGVTNSGGITNSTANSLRSFLGRASSASDALGGGIDLSGFFQANQNYSITDNNRNPVYTNKSGVDATTANSILALLTQAGCSVNTQEYLSSSDTDSLFGLGLILASLFGIKDLVNDILNCSHTNTVAGQLSLNKAFREVSGSQPDIAKSILDRIDNPVAANTADISKSILVNPDLSVKSKATVDAIFTTLGTSTKNELAISSASSAKYPVYNGILIPTIQPTFTNAVFEDTTISDYFAGKQMVLGADGIMRYSY